MAAKYFAMRNAWQQWQAKMAERKREHKLKVFEARILRTFLHRKFFRISAVMMLSPRRMDGPHSVTAAVEDFGTDYL